MITTAYPPKEKVHALILAMSEEIELLRGIADEAAFKRVPRELIERAQKLKLATQAAALAVGCRPAGPLNS